MLINILLQKIQTSVKSIYKNSYILQHIDWLIFASILLVIISSTTAQSDSIGYFALFSILLTTIKLITKTNEKLEMSLGDKFLLLYFITVVISVAGSSLFYLSFKGFLKTLTYIGFYVSCVHYLKNNINKLKYIFITLALCINFETIVAFLQNFGAVQEISGWQDMSRLNPEEIMTRVYGTLKPYNPNLFGGYLLSVIPVYAALPFINKKFTAYSIISTFFTAIAIVLTGCRGAYIGLFFELVFLICITYKYIKPIYKKVYTYITFICFLLTTFIILSKSALKARILSIFAMRNDSSNSFRFNVYNSCLNMFKDNWLLGIGCGNQNFREIYGLYMKTGFDALSAYNIYLETAVESGIFALLSFIAFLFINISQGIKYIFSNKTTESIFVLSALLAIIGMLMHGFVDTVFFRPQIQFTFWLMISIIRVITTNGEKRE